MKKKKDDIVDTIYACDGGFEERSVTKVGKHHFIKLKLAVQAADEIVRLRAVIEDLHSDLEFLQTDLNIIIEKAND
jgi:hypothetical protein